MYASGCVSQVRDELVDGPGLHGGSGDEDRRGVPDETDRLEVGDRVVTQGLHRRVHAVGGDVAEQEGVAVRSRSGHVLAGDGAVRARPVVDDDGPPEQRAEVPGDGTGDGVVGTARRRRNDQSERAANGRAAPCRCPRPVPAGRRGRREHVVGQVEIALEDLPGRADERRAADHDLAVALRDLDLDLDPALRVQHGDLVLPGRETALARPPCRAARTRSTPRSRRSPRGRSGTGAG